MAGLWDAAINSAATEYARATTSNGTYIKRKSAHIIRVMVVPNSFRGMCTSNKMLAVPLLKSLSPPGVSLVVSCSDLGCKVRWQLIRGWRR